MSATGGYVVDHVWTAERTRLGGLETAVDPGTRLLLERLGVVPGPHCLEVGAGTGTVARWLADQVTPHGRVVATDVDTDFLEAEVGSHPGVEVLRHDLDAEDLPEGGFDVVHARWVVHWLRDRPLAVRRMVAAVRPGGLVVVEEPDFVTAFHAGDPPVVPRVVLAAIRHLEATSPGDGEYGRRLPADLAAAGLTEVEAEGRCPLVRGGSPPAATSSASPSRRSARRCSRAGRSARPTSPRRSRPWRTRRSPWSCR